MVHIFQPLHEFKEFDWSELVAERIRVIGVVRGAYRRHVQRVSDSPLKI